MARARLSGELLEHRKAVPATMAVAADEPMEWDETAAADLSSFADQSDGAASGFAAAFPFAAPGEPAGSESEFAQPTPAARPGARRAAVGAVSALALGSLAGLLLLQPGDGRRAAEAALPAAQQALSGARTSDPLPDRQAPTITLSAVPGPQTTTESAVDLPTADRAAGASQESAQAAPAAARVNSIQPVVAAAVAPQVGPDAITTATATEAAPDASRQAAPDQPGNAAALDPTGPAANSAAFSASAASATDAKLPDAGPTASPVEAAPLAVPAVASAELMARGDALFVVGDVAAARLYYEQAANAGDGHAALQLGETYDPAFLAQTRFIGARANAAAAAYWYQKARDLGVLEAEILLKAIAADTGRS